MRAVLTYHAIDSSGSAIAVSPEAFLAHVAWLASGQVPVMGLAELLALPDGQDGVAITFDDALESVATVAAPLLAAHGLPATVFVVSGHVGGDNRWAGQASPGIPVGRVLGWDELDRLRSQGFSIGAHTRHHPDLRTCSHDQVVDEVAGSAAEIAAAMGLRPTGFAYPYGGFNAEIAAAVAEAFDIGCTTEFQPLHRGMQRPLVPRLDAWYFRDAAPLREWGTRSFRRRIAVRHALRRIRQLVA